jgi:hypothetical protein
MTTGELGFVLALFGVPLWLAATAWFRYFSMERVSVRALPWIRTGLTLMSITTVMWVGLLTIMILEDRSSDAKSLAKNLSPAIVAWINLLFCAGALICSRLDRRSAHPTAILRRNIALSSGLLMLIWLFVLSNPH